MERRTPAEIVARNIRSAIDAAGADPAVIAEATEIPLVALDGTSHPETPLHMSDLVSVGGFLRCSPALFLNGAAA